MCSTVAKKYVFWKEIMCSGKKICGLAKAFELFQENSILEKRMCVLSRKICVLARKICVLARKYLFFFFFSDTTDPLWLF